MKSRFLASLTVALTLLLGLVSSNLLAQITSASSVKFYLKSFNQDGGMVNPGWRSSTTAGEDTVGHLVNVRASFDASQPLTSADYTISFPAGTVVQPTAKDSVYIQYTEAGSTAPVEVKVDASKITITAGNDTSGYSSTIIPSIKITDNNTWSTTKQVQITFYKGIYFGKSVLNANVGVSGSASKKMKFGVLHSITPGNVTYYDSTNFYVVNDKASTVRLNSSVTSILDNGYFPNGDSLVILDRFGNFVPNWGGVANIDTLRISVASKTTVGQFLATPQFTTANLPFTNNFLKFSSDSTSIIFVSQTDGNGGQNVDAGLAYSNDDMYHVVQHTGATGNDFKKAVIIFLGEEAALQAAPASGATAGVKFDAVSTTDTVRFTYTIAGTNAAVGTLLNTPAGNVTYTTRSVSTASTTIGSLAISTVPTGTTYNGGTLCSGAVWKMTLKNVFGDPFNAQTVGTGTDSIRIIFKYRRSGAVNATMTSLLQAGGQITSQYTRAASRLYDGALTAGTFTTVSGGEYGVKMKGLATDASGVVTLTGAKYMGTTSHPQNDSIYVVAYAWNSPSVRDSFLINVEPSYPAYFDLDTLSANLTAANNANQVIKGAVIPRDLPVFALDTAYNRVSNLNLSTGGAATYLGSIRNQNENLPMINLLVDGRDPLGYESATSPDSIKLDSLQIAARAGITATALKDSSFIYGYDFARADSSRINFGGTGNAKMGLRLMYTGWRRVTMQWKTGTVGGAYTAGDVTKSLDLGLFNLQSPSLIDSVTAVDVVDQASPADSVGQVMQRVVQFTAGIGEAIGPNRGDSLIFVKFINLPAGAGIPEASINKDSVKVSVDNVTFYSALDVKGGAEADDSLAVLVPMDIPCTAATTIYIRIGGFVNPTQSDTTYGVKVATEASPVWASKAAAWTVNDGGFATMKIVARDSVTTDITTKTLSTVTGLGSYATAVANSAFYFKVVLADKYSNILNSASSATKTFKAKSVDSTATGGSLAIQQIWDGSNPGSYTNSKGLYDTLTVKTDSINNSTSKYVVIDSIKVTPAMAGSYYLVLSDNGSAAKDSILLTVKGTVSGSISVVSPLGKQTITKGATCDSALTVKLYDVLGNALADSVVTFAAVTGNVTFVDSNGVAVTAPNDTIMVKTNAMGIATVKAKAGTTGDSIAVAVYNTNSSVTRKYFTFNTTAASNLGPTTFAFVTKPDSVSPDTAAAKSVVVKVTDRDGVKKVKLMVSTYTLTLGTDNKFTKSATSVDTTVWDSTMKSTKPDSTNVTFSIAKKALGSMVEYSVAAYDANDSMTTSASQMFVVGAKRGKSNLLTAATDVADIMRLVYLVLGYATPGTIDWFGLDLNNDGAFTGDQDLVTILNIWKGTATLASTGEQQTRTAKASLSFKETDKANASLFIDLENKGELSYAEFQVKYDVTKYTMGEVSRTERIDQNIQVVYNNHKDTGILQIIVLNLQGRGITSGSGAILSVPVVALNGKFDGSGEISLLSVGFEQNVQSELSKEVLSPKASLPKAFALGQNYPNPFNPSTTVAYDIPEGKEVQVRLNIYNVRGQLVRTLVNEVKSEGSYQVQWDGSSNNGQKVSSGVYFYRLVAGEFNQTRKMVILK